MSDVFRLLRVYHDMKGNELAEKLGISKSYLSEVENGKKAPTLDLIQQYAKVFNTTPSALLFLSENLEKKNAATITQILNRKMLGFLKELADENSKVLSD